MKRKEVLKTGDTHHVMNKSIAGYKIFNSESDFDRFIKSLQFYSFDQNKIRFSQLFNSTVVQNYGFKQTMEKRMKDEEKLVQVIAYCVMPTHFHLILKQLKEEGISNYMKDVSNSHSHYFNNKNNRKGTLWESRFENVRVKTDEQLLHLTRYIHLNPTTAGLVEDPEDWIYSSYNEYISQEETGFCSYENILDIKPKKYKEFVDARKDYQRNLSKIKRITLE